MTAAAIVPNADLLADEDIPRITMGGVTWPIPRLAIRQLEKVVPLIVEALPILGRIGKEGLTPATGSVIHDLGTIVYLALERGHKGLTRDAFDDMAMTLEELLDAVPVVMRQSGLFRTVKPGERPPAGEAKGTSQIGTH